MKRMIDKSIIVSGGAGALGSQIAARLAAEGGRVLIADINLAAAERVAAAIGPNASAIYLDAYQESSIAAMIAAAVERNGGLDVLVNNVADTSLVVNDSTVLDITVELWDKTFAADIRSYFLATKYALPHMLAKGAGSIIHIASGSALAGDTLLTAYSAAKAGVLNFSKCVAAQYGRQGVRSNAICHGVIATDLGRERMADTLKTALDVSYTTRNGAPADIAALAAYLAADEAAFTNGATMICDGAHSAVAAPWRAGATLMN